MPTVYSKDLRNLITQMLNIDDTKRPSITAILRKSFIMNRITKFLSEIDIKDNFTKTFINKLSGEKENKENKVEAVKVVAKPKATKVGYSKKLVNKVESQLRKEIEKEIKKEAVKPKEVKINEAKVVDRPNKVKSNEVDKLVVDLTEDEKKDDNDTFFKESFEKIPDVLQKEVSNKDRFQDLKVSNLFGTAQAEKISNQLADVEAMMNEYAQEDELPLDFFEKDEEFDSRVELELTRKLEEIELNEVIEEKEVLKETKVKRKVESPRKDHRSEIKKMKADFKKNKAKGFGFEFVDKDKVEAVTPKENDKISQKEWIVEKNEQKQQESEVKKSTLKQKQTIKDVAEKKEKSPKKSIPKVQHDRNELRSFIQQMKKQNKKKGTIDVILIEGQQVTPVYEVVEEKREMPETKEESENDEELVKALEEKSEMLENMFELADQAAEEEEVVEEINEEFENINELTESAYFTYMSFNMNREEKPSENDDYAALEMMRIDLEKKLGLEIFRKLYEIVDTNVCF